MHALCKLTLFNEKKFNLHCFAENTILKHKTKQCLPRRNKLVLRSILRFLPIANSIQLQISCAACLPLSGQPEICKIAQTICRLQSQSCVQCTSCSAHYSTRMFTVCSMYCTVLQSQSCAIYSAPVAVLTTVREVHCVQYILYCTVLYCSKKCSYLNYNTYATYKKSARKQFFKKPYLDPTLL